jgi:hypothetical protein
MAAAKKIGGGFSIRTEPVEPRRTTEEWLQDQVNTDSANDMDKRGY